MRKVSAALLAAMLVLLSSCATSVSLRYMQPSVVDMGGYRNLAVASVVPYNGFIPSTGWVRAADIHASGLRIHSGYSYSTAASVAAYATDQLYTALSSTGFFNLLPPGETDRVIADGGLGGDISSSLHSLGYDAVLIPRIRMMSVDETVYSVPREEWWVDEDGVRHRIIEFDYRYTQTASIEYVLTVIDGSSCSMFPQSVHTALRLCRTSRRTRVWKRRMRLRQMAILLLPGKSSSHRGSRKVISPPDTMQLSSWQQMAIMMDR